MAAEKEFNAKVGLKGFDATESRPLGSGKNALEVGKEYIFIDTGKKGYWGRDKEGKRQEFPLVRTDNGGIICNAPYVASCMIDAEGIIQNADKEEKFHCMVTPRISKEENLGLDHVQNHILDDKGTFPKLKVVRTLPVAIKRADLIANASEETKAVYQQKLGTTLDKLDHEYVPSYRKSQFTANDGIFSIKSSIVELT